MSFSNALRLYFNRLNGVVNLITGTNGAAELQAPHAMLMSEVDQASGGTTVANNLIQAQEAAFEILPGGKTWFGVTYTEDKPVVIEALRQLHDQGEYPTTLW
jgi:hypothetical protein